MKYLMFTLLVILTVTQSKSATSQTTKMPHLIVMMELLGNIGVSGEIVNRNCSIKSRAFWPVLFEKSARSRLSTLDKDPKIMRMVDNCKKRLAKSGVNTRGTDALFLIVEKLMALTKKEWFLLKSLAPPDAEINKLFKQKMTK
jgi:hypothetical protein